MTAFTCFCRAATRLLLLLLASNSAYSQEEMLRKADESYSIFEYGAAAREYEAYLNAVGDTSWTVQAKIADCYWKLFQYEEAAKWHEKATNHGAHPELLLQYGHDLKMIGQYDLAKEVFGTYLKITGDQKTFDFEIESCNFSVATQQDSNGYILIHLPFSTMDSDLGLTVGSDGYYFVSVNNGNYDVFYTKNLETDAEHVKKIKGKLNTSSHEGPISFSAGGDTMLFTRSRQNAFYEETGAGAVNILSIERVSRKSQKKSWKPISGMPFNSDEHSVGHPAVSANGSFIVFSSPKPGGFGESDLYVSFRDPEGNWTEPVNLGSEINTAGTEEFPFIHESGRLFFSSDGHVGLGGLDIIVAQPDGHNWKSPSNPGFPINSPRDDFSITWIPGKPGGYFASDRPGGLGSDDLYEFEWRVPIHIVTKDSITGLPIPGAVFEYNNAMGEWQTRESDAEGKLSIVMPLDNQIDFSVSANSYKPKVITTNTIGIEVSHYVDLEVLLMPLNQLGISVLVKDSVTGLPIPNTLVSVFGTTERKLRTDDEGRLNVDIENAGQYTVIAQAKGYLPGIETVNAAERASENGIHVTFLLNKGDYVIASGVTRNANTGQPIANVRLLVTKLEDYQPIHQRYSRGDGRFWIVLDTGVSYSIIGSRDGYFIGRVNVPNLHTSDTMIEVGLLPLVDRKENEIVRIIYFDFSRSDITGKYGKDLMDIAIFLQDNPEAVIALSSHTDSRGSDSFNHHLSLMRSAACVQFLRAVGISSGRVVSHAMGEREPANRCSDGVVCSDAEHAKNRRAEIRIDEIMPGPARIARDEAQNEIPPSLDANYEDEYYKLKIGDQKDAPLNLKFAVLVKALAENPSDQLKASLKDLGKDLIMDYEGFLTLMMIGNYSSYSEAKSKLEKLETYGFKDAFVVAVSHKGKHLITVVAKK